VTRVIDPAQVARQFRDEIRAEVAALPRRLRLVGVLATEQGPSVTYAEYTRKACDDVGVSFDLRRVPRLEAEQTIRAVNGDPDVDGLFIYYPVFGTGQDSYLRDLVDPGKDVEGLHELWARCLYENRRFVDREGGRKAILPCTPLAILKLLDEAGASTPGGDDREAGLSRPLAGRTACIFNRSEVIGRPLAAMMANDGAEVFSFDLDGPLCFVPAPEGPAGVHRVQEVAIDRTAALARADIVITGVPSPTFARVRAAEVRADAICINFSTLKNFEEDVVGRVAAFIPRVGPMTVTMALRNTLRLHANRQA
jgi:methylenetetrahydrofolate dehydrogenase (NADP+)/methenyltetrahydrofolate cyclohydrolase